MRVVIIEDEELAAWGLSSKLAQAEPAMEVIATLDSVKTAVAWFRENPVPDLAFFDIQLADGLSFEIFEQAPVSCPVIFTTAYDAYALKAFKVNSVDYLLKPVSAEDLSQALSKLRQLRGAPAMDAAMIRQMVEVLRPKSHKTRFMVKIGDQLSAVETSDIDFFFGENKTVWLRRNNGRKYVVDYTLEQLEDLLDPAHFFRLNRSYIAHFEAIDKITVLSKSRVKVDLKPVAPREVIVSTETARDFKAWLNQ